MDSTVLDAGIAAQQLQLVNAIVDEDRQYATRLTITRTDNENASESVISTVISWLMKKKVLSKEHCDSFREGTYSTPDGWNGTTELEQGKTALASKRNSGVPGCVVWAMELDEQDHRLIYGRWHTRIGIIGNADSCIVNIQLSRYIVRGFIGEAAPPIPSTPRIVKMLFSDEANVVRVGSTFLNDKPIYLTSETLTSKFIPDLTDPNRTLSLILITTDEESKLPVRNLKNLTKQLFGMLSIARIPSGRVNTMDSKRTMMRPQSSFCFASTSLTRGFTSRAWMPSLWYGVPRRRRFSISSLGVH